MATLSRKATPATIDQFTVVSNDGSGNSVGLQNGAINLTYYESILQDTIHATFTYADSGTVNGPFGGKSAIDGLPIRGSEECTLIFTDNLDNQLTFNDTNALYVNS